MLFKKFNHRAATLLLIPLHLTGMTQELDEDDIDRAFKTKPYVSIATGSAHALRTAPAVASVITSEDIAAMGAVDLDQILESVAGLHVSRSPIMYQPLYIVRGIVSAQTPQVLVLQNGIPVTELFQGTKGDVWISYPVEHIARIEVLRGPGSALYGADAYSGVINIITKSSSDTQGTQISAKVGSYSTKDLSVLNSSIVGDAHISAYLRRATTKGFDGKIDADAQTLTDKIFGSNASLAPGRLYTGHDSIDANVDIHMGRLRFIAGLKIRDNSQTGAGVAQAIDPIGRVKSVRTTTSTSFTDPRFSDDIGIGFSFSTMYYKQAINENVTLRPPGTILPTGTFPDGLIGNPSHWQRQYRTSSFVSYSGVPNHALRIGAGYEDLNLYKTHETRNFEYDEFGMPIRLPTVVPVSKDSIYLEPNRRKVRYLYIQDEWDVSSKTTITSGVRYDDYSDFGRTINPRFAAVWEATPTITTKFLYGRAFRAPAFNESFAGGNPVLRGNPSIKPEMINTFDASVQWQPRMDLQMVATAYKLSRRSIIEQAPDPTLVTGTTFLNSGQQRGRGLELEAIYSPNKDVKLIANASFQKTINVGNNSDAGYAPHRQFYGRIEYKHSDTLLVAPQLNCVAGRHRAFGDDRAPVADYCTSDLSATIDSYNGEWRTVFSLRNMFNADAREPNIALPLQIPGDIPLPRRNVSIQLTRSF